MPALQAGGEGAIPSQSKRVTLKYCSFNPKSRDLIMDRMRGSNFS